jgi:hypothetical protein
MKNNKKINFLIESGVSKNTISKMNENQINLMVERFKKLKKQENKEAVVKTTIPPGEKITADLADVQKTGISVDGTNISMQGGKVVIRKGGEKTEEITEGDVDNVSSANAQGDVELQKYTGQEAPHMASDMAPDGMDDDSDTDRSDMGMSESTLNEKFESKAQQGLFWARCNKCSSKDCKWCKMAKEFSDSTSKKQYKTMPEKKHPEKTVKYKKKKTNEETQKFLENQILKMLEEEKRKQTKKKKSENMILKNPKKVTMFSDEAPMQLPLGKMFSIGFK